MNLKTLAITIGLALGITGCAGGQLNQDALRAVKVPFQLYTDVYQPVLITYGRLPDCTTPKTTPICRDYPLFAKLVDIDGKVVIAMQLADTAIASGETEGDAITKATVAVTQAMTIMAPLLAQGDK